MCEVEEVMSKSQLAGHDPLVAVAPRSNDASITEAIGSGFTTEAIEVWWT